MPTCLRCGAELVPPYAFCGQCGQPVGAPGFRPPYPYYLPPKKDNILMIIVIVLVLVIAIPTILAAALYIMVSGQIGTGGSLKPFVTFSGTTKVNAVTWTFSVDSASPAVAPSNYKVNFGIGTFTGTAANMGATGANTTVTVTGATPASVGVKWTDLGSDGLLDAGDTFTVTFPSAPVSGALLTFYLLYADGAQLQTMTWQA